MELRSVPTATKDLFRKTYEEWSRDKASRLGAAISYYTVFSLAPLLVITIAVASFVVGGDTARQSIIETTGGLVGPDGAKAIEGMIDNAAKNQSTGVFATIIGIVMLLLGASGVFVELQGALNTVWGVEEKRDEGFMAFLKHRMLSFAMVLSIGFLLLVSLVLSAVLTAVGDWVSASLPGGSVMWHIVNGVVSLLMSAALFALIFKFLPDIKIAWKDVAVGAIVTALLFTLGKALIGLYLGKSSTASVFGAAGSLAIVFIWVYYSAQIVLFGAEFTQVWADEYGSHVETGTPKRVKCEQADQARRPESARGRRTPVAPRLHDGRPVPSV
jgi:membrane protein